MRMIVACAVAVAGISATFGGAEPLRERAVVEEGVRTADYQLCRRSTDAHGGRTSAKGPCTSGIEALADLPKTTLDVGCADQDAVMDVSAWNAAHAQPSFLPGGTPDESVLWGHLSLTANNGSF